MNKAELKQFEVEKLMSKNDFKRFYPEAYERAFPSPKPVMSAIDTVVDTIVENFEITEDVEEADIVVVVHDVDELPSETMIPPLPEEPTLQDELENIVEEAKEVVEKIAEEDIEVLPVPDDSNIQSFLSDLLEKDEDKLIKILRRLKN